MEETHLDSLGNGNRRTRETLQEALHKCLRHPIL
jgi:hypothetical protein